MSSPEVSFAAAKRRPAHENGLSEKAHVRYHFSLPTRIFMVNRVYRVYITTFDSIFGSKNFIAVVPAMSIMREKRRILIAEDHTILREGLRALLSAEPEFTVVGEAEDGRAAIRSAESLTPDLILLDLSMPRMNGMEAIREIKKRCPETKILVLTVHKTEEYIMAALEAGAEGYVLKDADHSELIMAIKTILQGHTYLSPGISGKVVRGYLNGRKTSEFSTSWDSLTQREREVLKLIAEGYKNREIADYLYISVKTVEKHRANLMKKLDLHNASALTAFAMEKGLIAE
jgi:two-component system response regulator NreC